MPTNKAFKTIPGTINIPSDVDDFKTTSQVVWTGSTWRRKNTFSPDYGDTSSFPNDNEYTVEKQRSMYTAYQSDGLTVKATGVGKVHQCNFELYGDGRWMAASVFNGLGFEVWQSLGSKHGVFLKKYALVFANRDNSNYRIWGVDTGATAPSGGYRYIKVLSTAGMVNTIRSWGPSWLFQGIIVHIANKGPTGSSTSTIDIYNMRVGSKMNTLGGQYRMLPAGKRRYDHRKVTADNVGFDNPFS